MKRAAGFTLIEILISLAITALLLLGLNAFIFSMGELWGRNSDVRLFNQHVNAVSRFLEEEFRIATFPPYARASSQPIAPEQVTAPNGIQDTFLTFELTDGCRVLNWPDRPLPEVVCSLQVVPNSGLHLIWQSRLETTFQVQPPRDLVLTPFVTGIAYDYYDTNAHSWTTSPTLNLDTSTGMPLVPADIRLTFTYGKMSRTSIILIPAALQGLPNT